MLSGAAATFFLRIDQLMIGNMIDKTAVGYFSTATKFVEILLFFPNIIIQTVSPILVRIKSTNFTEYRQKSQLFMDATFYFCFFMSILLCLISYYVIYLTFGNDYLSAVPILQVLAFKLPFVALNVVSGQIMIIDHKQKYFVLRSIAGCIFCVLGNYLLIPEYGVLAVAFVTIITQIVAGFLVHAFIPSYRYVFKMQINTMVYGWKSMLKLKQLK